MLKRYLLILASTLLLSTAPARAGVDVSGLVPLIWVSGNGDLWFTVNSPTVPTYCLPGWYGVTMTVPRSDPNYAYYYGLIATAVAKGKSVYIANISIYNGTTPCDITRTGYGVVLLP